MSALKYVVSGLAALTLLPTGCAGLWRSCGAGDLPAGEERNDSLDAADLLSPRRVTHGGPTPLSSRAAGASGEFETPPKRNPAKLATLKQLQETSADLPPRQQRLLPHLAATLSRHADIGPAPQPPRLTPENAFDPVGVSAAQRSSAPERMRISDLEPVPSPAQSTTRTVGAGSVELARFENTTSPAQSPAPATILDRRGTTILETHSPDDSEPKQPAGPNAIESDPDDEQSFQPGRWQTTCSKAIEQLEKELVWGEVDDNERTRMEASLRLLYLLANKREKAVEPIKELTEDERQFWKHQLFGLSISLDLENRHAPPRQAALALRELRTAAGYLANVSTLDVRNLAFCKRVESFGRYEEFQPYSFESGQEILLYVEVENFATESVNDEYHTELKGEYAIVDAKGNRVVSTGLPPDKQTCSNRRRDYFIAYRLFLPDEMAPGQYTLTLTMEDVEGQKSNQGSIEFRVR